MLIHPEYRPVYDAGARLDIYADLPAARAALAGASATGHREAAVDVEDRVIVTAAGELALRLYVPAAVKRERPAAVWIHGGGFALGAPNAEDATCRRLSRELGMVVVAPDYRLAPEHPFPAAFQDCLATLEWAVEQAVPLGIDPSRTAVGGHSAGAALALGTALAARDREGPAIAYLYLGYPVLDDRQDTASARQITDAKLWNRDSVRRMWRLYLQDADPESRYAVPARSADLSGLPATYLMIAGLDPHRDEALAFAGRLTAAGVPLELNLVPGVPHMFDVLAPEAAVTRRAVAAWTRALASGLGITKHD